MLVNQPLQIPELVPCESRASFKPYGDQPELRFTIVPFNMHVWWLVAISGVEKESVGATAKNCRHSRESSRGWRSAKVRETGGRCVVTGRTRLS